MLKTLNIQQLVSLKNYCTLKVGGNAKYLVEVKTEEEVKQAIRFSKEKGESFIALGKGSNCLFDDKGFNGLVIICALDFYEKNANIYHVGAGFNFARLGFLTAKDGFGGLEFAAGIPASVGGAICMNAGANGLETKDTLKSATYIDKEGHLITKQAKDLQFSYRSSFFQKEPCVITSAYFCLYEDASAKKRQSEFVKYRIDTQPYKSLTAGCFFRNNIKSAGALIEESGLKGYRIGDARVSLMHANFIENVGNATSEDIKALILHVQNVVKEQHNVELQLEVKVIPYDI